MCRNICRPGIYTTVSNAIFQIYLYYQKNIFYRTNAKKLIRYRWLMLMSERVCEWNTTKPSVFKGKRGARKGTKKKLMTDRGKGKREREKGIKICHLRGEEKEKRKTTKCSSAADAAANRPRWCPVRAHAAGTKLDLQSPPTHTSTLFLKGFHFSTFWKVA